MGCSNERYADGTEGYHEEPLINQEVLHPDISAELPGVELDCEHTVSAIQEDDTDNPEEVEAASARALKKSYITLPHHIELSQVINKAPEVSYDEYNKDFNINEAENTKTQVHAEETVEDKEASNNNEFLKMVTRVTTMKTTHHMYDVLPE